MEEVSFPLIQQPSVKIPAAHSSLLSTQAPGGSCTVAKLSWITLSCDDWTGIHSKSKATTYGLIGAIQTGEESVLSVLEGERLDPGRS